VDGQLDVWAIISTYTGAYMWSFVTGLWSHDKARAHKGGIRIGKTPKKLDSICCPQHRETKADILKRQRPIGEGNQELEKRLVWEELI
jgi:hypothetical protein